MLSLYSILNLNYTLMLGKLQSQVHHKSEPGGPPQTISQNPKTPKFSESNLKMDNNFSPMRQSRLHIDDISAAQAFQFNSFD